MLYTDGVTEAFSPADDEFGEERLVEAVRRCREAPAERMLTAVVDAVREFSPLEQRDDVTLIVAKARE